MSYQVLDVRVYEALAQTLYSAGKGGHLDLYEFPVCRDLGKVAIETNVRIWYLLNIDTFHEPAFSFPILSRIPFNRQPMNSWQFVRAVEMVLTNIDRERIERRRPLTGEETTALNFLANLLLGVFATIVHKQPRYQSAQIDC